LWVCVATVVATDDLSMIQRRWQGALLSSCVQSNSGSVSTIFGIVVVRVNVLDGITVGSDL
jgi:hypothetical protein